MTDAGATPEDEDRLPWLEAVEDEEGGGPPIGKLIGVIVLGLIIIGLVVGGLFWAANRNRGDGAPGGEVIAAPEGDYKVRPDQPGGMNVSGTGATADAVSAGEEPRGRIAAPDARAARPPASRAPAPAATPTRPAPAPAAGPRIQLGAFSNQAAASRAWTALSGRFRYLAGLGHEVVPVTAGGRTLYRLRASGPDAAAACRRLQVAGEDCAVVD